MWLVRKALNAVITDRHSCNLIDEKLLTLLKNAGLLLNCRPLTRVSPDPEDWRALIPMTLLNGCMNVALPMGAFANSDSFRGLKLAAHGPNLARHTLFRGLRLEIDKSETDSK